MNNWKMTICVGIRYTEEKIISEQLLFFTMFVVLDNKLECFKMYFLSFNGQAHKVSKIFYLDWKTKNVFFFQIWLLFLPVFSPKKFIFLDESKTRSRLWLLLHLPALKSRVGLLKNNKFLSLSFLLDTNFISSHKSQVLVLSIYRRPSLSINLFFLSAGLWIQLLFF